MDFAAFKKEIANVASQAFAFIDNYSIVTADGWFVKLPSPIQIGQGTYRETYSYLGCDDRGYKFLAHSNKHDSYVQMVNRIESREDVINLASLLQSIK